MTLSECYKIFSKIGKIEKWFTKNSPDKNGRFGYGFIREDNKNAKYFAHITKYAIKERIHQKDFSLDEKNCLFVIGKDPLRRTSESCVLSFITNEDINDDITDYKNKRQIALRSYTTNELIDLINAQWYLKLWAKEKKNPPKLEMDIDLFNDITYRLNSSDNPFNTRNSLIKALDSTIFEKPKYVLEIIEGFNYKVELENAIKAGIFEYSKESKWFNNLSEDRKTVFINEFLISVSISIDLEADEDSIYQTGITGYNIKSEDIVTIKNLSSYYWLIGHNIIEWDIPIVKKLYPNVILPRIIWDTLLVSWLLEPWKRTHALTTSIKAHNALEDALASLKLFFGQSKKFSIEGLIRYANTKMNDADRIKLLGEILNEIEYKSADKPSWLDKINHKYILPDFLVDEVLWIQNVAFCWPRGYIDLEDQIIDLSKLKDVQIKNPNNVYLALVLVVIENAKKMHIQVLIRMLPLWIKDKIQNFLSAIISDDSPSNENSFKIITYKALVKTELPEEIQKILNAPGTICLPGGESELLGEGEYLNNERIATLKNELNKSEIIKKTRILDHNSYPTSSLILRIDENAIAKDDKKITLTRWLEFLPAYRRSNQNSPLRLYKCYEYKYNAIELNNIKSTCKVPIWLDEEDQNKIDKIFLNPLSGRRKQYWEDVVSRLLSFIESSEHSRIFVFLLEFNEELTVIRNILSSLNYTKISNKDSILRQLEDVFIKHKKRIFIDSIKHARNIFTASIELNLSAEFIIESVPINNWRIGYQRELKRKDDEDGISEDDIDESYYEDDEINELESTSETKYDFYLDLASWGDYLENKIKIWLLGLFGSSNKSIIPLVLDSRLSQGLTSKNSAIEYERFYYKDLSEDILNTLALYTDEFADIERKDAPLEYEAYRNFLERNWNYNDFKQTQIEPVKAIIPNDKDVIVRLPTGEGKSVIFQVPALLRTFYTKRLSIVISPLRALMTDQVERLWNEGFILDVDYLNGDREYWENLEVYQHIVDGQVKLLYVAPERFRVKKFRDAISRRFIADGGFEYIILDEAHCISQWGFEFRPDYLYCMSEIIDEFRGNNSDYNTSLIFFSATITEAIKDDIVNLAKLGNNNKSYLLLPENLPHPIREFIKVETELMNNGLYNNGLFNRIDFIESIIRKSNPTQSAILLFCTRKKHTEELEEIISKKELNIKNTNIVVRCFHADLPVEERLEVYEELKEGKVHVLAATKAFGMGMDISNLHWCVHLAPPNYLEDYLQEVGRTGRDDSKRKAAGLQEIQCYLLAHPEDFDRTRTLIQRNKIGPPDLSVIFNFILTKSQLIPDSEEAISVVPDEGFANLKPDQFRKTLFWLEKSGRINILGKLPNILKVTINIPNLNRALQGTNDKARVVKAILNVIDEPQKIELNVIQKAESIIKKVFNLLAKTVGLFLKKEEKNIPGLVQPNDIELDINLAALFQEADLKYLDDAFRLLGELQNDKCLRIVRELKFKEGRYIDVNQTMWIWLDTLITNYLKSTNGREMEINEEELSSLLTISDNQIQNWPNNQQYLRVGKRRCLKSLIRLLRISGIKVRKQLNEQKQPIFIYIISDNQLFGSKRNIDIVIKIARLLFQYLLKNSSSVYEMGEILNTISQIKNYKIIDIQSALKLLSSLGFFSTQDSLLPWSYVLHIKNKTPFPGNPLVPGITEKDKECIQQINRTNELARLRSFAFEIFSLVPPELHKNFINEYFKIPDENELETFIVEQATDLTQRSEHLEQQLQEVISRVRKEEFIKEFELLNEEQKDVCMLPYNNTILVNAGPGSGKTRVLIMRAATLIHNQGLQPENILILAFNRAVVYEIKSRTTELFRKLGYGSYASKIQVYTFHSFAVKNYPENIDNMELENLLHSFTEEIMQDDNLTRTVTDNIRCIMVDEFQDMNEDFYNLILQLKEVSGAGIMVIGDDDQDILMWNRMNWQESFGNTRLHSNEYFNSYQLRFSENIITKSLTLNYRSCDLIVKRSQKLLNNNIFTQSRIKRDIELLTERGCEGSVEKVKANEFEKNIFSIWEEKEKSKSLAILCRTNFDCYEVAETLDRLEIPHNVLGDSDYPLSWIRSIGHWIDCCNNYILENNSNFQILNDNLYNEVNKIYQKLKLPDDSVDIKQIWDFTLKENPRSSLKNHINFLKETKKSDLIRMLRRIETEQILVSTIHKVKGLEFDIVYLKSSQASFPLKNNNNLDMTNFTLEEYRLWYVGMTRAKEKLFFEWDEREECWRNSREHQIDSKDDTVILSGSPGEVDISWPARTQTDMQDYLRQNLKVNDIATRRGAYLIKSNTKISCLSNGVWKEITDYNNSSLKVSEILRYPVEPAKAIQFGVAQKYIDQGWYYVVLFKGKIWK